MEKKNNEIQKEKIKRRPFFRFFKTVTKMFVKKPKIVNLNETIENGSIFLCNHSGATGPFVLEYYFPRDFHFWGTYEMTLGFKDRWRYMAYREFLLTRHNSKFMSKVKASVVATFSGMFYKGLQLIPTYPDGRLKTTIETSMDYLNKGSNIIIFPEDISHGYFDVLKTYFSGFWLLAKQYVEKFKKDIKIYNMYFKKKTKTLIIDKAISVKELLKKSLDRKKIAEQFKDRANELATLI